MGAQPTQHRTSTTRTGRHDDGSIQPRPPGLTLVNPTTKEPPCAPSTAAIPHPPTAERDRSQSVRVAFLARVSTDDQQDPTLSLPRQLANCEAALPEGWRITAWFWDIESGRMALERRGRGHAHERIDVPLPRDGGLTDLLGEADHPGRRFDAVICESIDRLARRTYIGTRIEHDLEEAGVRLYAADEPIDPRGKRSTGLLTRRVKQGVAEWYVTDMLERSWDGFKVHTGQGWNIGKPPYGYAADKVEHPVPAKAAEGQTKTRLVPDPQQAPVVAYIYKLRVVERLGYDAIAARLNTDPDRYPVPEPTSAHRRRGVWSGSAVRDVLHNPKYTGYMVWNRKRASSRDLRNTSTSTVSGTLSGPSTPIRRRSLFMERKFKLGPASMIGRWLIVPLSPPSCPDGHPARSGPHPAPPSPPARPAVQRGQPR